MKRLADSGNRRIALAAVLTALLAFFATCLSNAGGQPASINGPGVNWRVHAEKIMAAVVVPGDVPVASVLWETYLIPSFCRPVETHRGMGYSFEFGKGASVRLVVVYVITRTDERYLVGRWFIKSKIGKVGASPYMGNEHIYRMKKCGSRMEI